MDAIVSKEILWHNSKLFTKIRRIADQGSFLFAGSNRSSKGKDMLLSCKGGVTAQSLHRVGSAKSFRRAGRRFG